MSTIIVDIADMAVSSNPEDSLITYSLGSCLGVVIYDPVIRVGGMIHCMLPLSNVDQVKADTRPGMFVDTGVPMMLQKLFDMGLKKTRAVVKVAGASLILDKQGLFRIGERNYTVFRKIMWKNGILITAEDIGGDLSRTVQLDIGTGVFTVKSKGKVTEL